MEKKLVYKDVKDGWLTGGPEKAEGSRVGWGPKVKGFICVWPQQDTPDNRLRKSIISWQRGEGEITGCGGEGRKSEKTITEWVERMRLTGRVEALKGQNGEGNGKNNNNLNI